MCAFSLAKALHLFEERAQRDLWRRVASPRQAEQCDKMKRQVLAPGLLTQSLAIFDLPARATLHYAVAVEVWTDRGEDVFYLPGDPLCVYFRAPEDCYLLLYQMDTQGNVYLLFPAPYSRAFFARAGEVPCVNDFLYDCHLAVHGTVGVG